MPAPERGPPRALPPARSLPSRLGPPEVSRGLGRLTPRGGAWRGKGAASRPAGRPGDAPPAPSRPGARRCSPTFSKFNHYLNPKGNEQTSRIGCQGIFSLAGRIYPEVFPQQAISGPRGRFRSADAVATRRAPGRRHRGRVIHGPDPGAALPKQAARLGGRGEYPGPDGSGGFGAGLFHSRRSSQSVS